MAGLVNPAVSAQTLSADAQGKRRYASEQQTGPYRGGLQSDFNFGQRSFTTGPGGMPTGVKYSDPNGYGHASGGFSDQDADVRGAANAAAELQMPGAGTNSAEQQALLNMYKGRIGQKNSLSESIAANPGMERSQEDLLKGAAGQSLGEGLKKTRENYNSRGLLYSGMRQGGEQQVRQGVASQLSSGISGTKREASNSLSAAQNAYAAVDMQNAQESLQLAHQAFDTASANNIARMQAMQQLGHGVGSVAGAYFGGRGPSGPGGGNAQPSPGGRSYYDTSYTNDYYDSSGSGASRTA